ncbi:ribonuclease HI [Candidatus Liberibacter sp.]|uniref:ribonuclease HI n=1 Tax=Candidatus Liberibacter sp. TaxID=34022 RepID=UPI0015F43EAD|nr:ribonuclease HI [Candidatus Liberibacter sp.]MBA5724264.1 ribonuclease HI [Candidatus Liberibacter sp.]
MKHVKAYTDGACSGNPGPGGWAVLLRYEGTEKKLSGGEQESTNNRMELMAAIAALTSLKYPCKVDLYTDSTYVHKGLSQWVKTWEKNGWRTTGNELVKNVELWKKLLKAKKIHEVTLHWIKGHSGHRENEIVDAMARNAVAAFRKNNKNPL